MKYVRASQYRLARTYFDDVKCVGPSHMNGYAMDGLVMGEG